MTARGERRAPSDWPWRRRATLYKVGGRGRPVSLRPVAAGLGGAAPLCARRLQEDGDAEGRVRDEGGRPRGGRHPLPAAGWGRGWGRRRAGATLLGGGAESRRGAGGQARPCPPLLTSPHGRGGGLGVCGGVTVVTVSARGADPPSKVRLPAGGGAALGLLVAVNRPEQPQK